MHARSSSSSPTQSFPPGFRSRRSHAKSRNGCLTCKQRRKKCDEKRPCCTLCETSLRTCTYASSDQGSSRSGESAAASRSSLPSPVPSPPGSFGGSLSWAQPTEKLLPVSPAASSGQGSIIDNVVSSNLTDSDLYFHFLHHTCRTAPSWQKDRLLLQVGIAKLALDNELASHSVLALAAACVCCDTMSRADADPEKVRHILDLGLQHHTLALEQMRTMTSRPRESDTQPLLASALMLVPFALAFQHIQHWVVRAKGSPQHDADLVTPRDMILLLRGIRTTIVALNSSRVENAGSKPKSFWDTMLSSQPTEPTETPTMPERLHTMYPILASTFYQASWQLKCRIESALAGPQVDEKIDSITATYEILNDIMSSTFLDCPSSKVPFEYASSFSVCPDSLLAQAPGWLQNFILQRPRPSHVEPLSRSFLAFFSSAPQTYIDLLLPLLDPRTDAAEDDRELSTAEVLALDVYAHWLVVMLLLEKEAWWVGDFPFVALQGLVARYGHAFLSACSSQQQWWPAAMLEVAVRLRQWK